MRFSIVLTSGEDGWIMAQCPRISGCISQGKDRAEALANIQEAIQLCLETANEEDATWSLPLDVEVLAVEVAA